MEFTIISQIFIKAIYEYFELFSKFLNSFQGKLGNFKLFAAEKPPFFPSSVDTTLLLSEKVRPTL